MEIMNCPKKKRERKEKKEGFPSRDAHSSEWRSYRVGQSLERGHVDMSLCKGGLHRKNEKVVRIRGGEGTAMRPLNDSPLSVEMAPSPLDADSTGPWRGPLSFPLRFQYNFEACLAYPFVESSQQRKCQQRT